jgi:hypothetical protein
MAAVLLCVEASAGEPDPAHIAVVVHPQNKLQGLSSSKLRAIFMRNRIRWPDGKPIWLLNWDGRSGLRISFDQLVLKMSPDKVSRYWIDRRIRGLGRPPRSIGSAQVIQSIVSRQEKAISYLRATEVGPKVKVLAIDGLRPGESGYPIKMVEAR